MFQILKQCFRQLAGFAVGVALSFISVSLVTAAVGNGTKNGEDAAGWPGGIDGPGIQQDWSYSQIAHNLILSEWIEPSHDWVRNRAMDWSSAAENKLDSISSTRSLEYAIKIRDQFYYNGINSGFNTNLPYSKAPEGSSFPEEAVDGHTEIEMEQNNPSLISDVTVYFWDQQFDSEKSAIATAPTFWSAMENCNKSWNDCFTDNTGEMRKKVLQR